MSLVLNRFTVILVGNVNDRFPFGSLRSGDVNFDFPLSPTLYTEKQLILNFLFGVLRFTQPPRSNPSFAIPFSECLSVFKADHVIEEIDDYFSDYRDFT